MLSFIDKLLSKIPGDGNKTVVLLGLKEAILPLIGMFIPALQPLVIVDIVDKILSAGVAVSVAHKAIKSVVR